MPLERLNDFSPGSIIRSAEVDAEFDQIVNILNGTTIDDSVAIGGEIGDSPSPNPKLYVEGQTVFATSVNGAVVRIFKLGGANAAIDLKNSGEIVTLAGNQSASPTTQTMIANGCLGYSSANVGNIGVGEDTLKTFTISGNVLGAGGSKGVLLLRARGYTAANANNKQLKFYVKTTNVLASGAVAFNNKPWFLDLEIGYDTDGVATLTVTGTFKCDATEVRVNSQVTGFDPTIDNAISITGEATADNDIVMNLIVITKCAGTAI